MAALPLLKYSPKSFFQASKWGNPNLNLWNVLSFIDCLSYGLCLDEPSDDYYVIFIELSDV